MPGQNGYNSMCNIPITIGEKYKSLPAIYYTTKHISVPIAPITRQEHFSIKVTGKIICPSLIHDSNLEKN